MKQGTENTPKDMTFHHLQEDLVINMIPRKWTLQQKQEWILFASKRFVEKTAEITSDLIGNDITNKITSAGKPRSNKTQEIFVPPENDHDQSGQTYNVSNQIRFKVSMLRSDLDNYCDVCIAVKATITVAEPNSRDKTNGHLVLKNNPPFICCISKINVILGDN